MSPAVDPVEMVRVAKEVLWPSGLFLGVALWGYGVVPRTKPHKPVPVRGQGKKHHSSGSINLLKHAAEADNEWQPVKKNLLKGSQDA